MAVLLLAGLAEAGPYDTWGKYKTLTINTTNTGGGANVTTAQTNFPVLIRLLTANAEDILGEALANGADVRFSSSDGSTALSYQIERWGSTRADIWVLVPSVAGNSTTDIRIYWKKSGQSDASSASSVFASSNSFATVWHLNESPGAGANGFSDATGGGNTGTAQAGAAGDTVTAIAGKAFVLNGSTKYVSPAAATSNALNTITVSAWFKTANAYGSGGKIAGFGSAATGSSSGYDRHLYMGNDGKINWGVNKAGSGTLVAITSGSAYNDGNWHLATGRLSASGMFLYVDGSQVATDATVTSGQTYVSAYWRAGYDNLQFWGNAPTSYFLNGSLDEVILSTAERSADWIKLSYQTQRTDATCIIYGSTQASTFYWNRDDVLTTSTDFNKAFNWSMNVDGTGRRAPSSADDDFTTTSIGGSWTCQDADNNVGTGTCDQTTKYGRLTIQGRGSDLWSTTNEFTALRRSDITGDFDVVVRVDSIYNTNTAAKAGIFMANDFTNLASGGYGGIALRGDNKIELEVATGTLGQLSSIGVSASAVTPPVWLRLVKTGSSVSGYYRTSLASAWTQQNTTQTALSTNANSQVALLLCGHNTGLTGLAVFDEFQGGFTLSSGQTLSFTGTGSNADANATMTANLTAASIDFTGYTGTFGFGSYTLTINSGNATFGSTATINPGTGTLAFTGTSGTQVLTPSSGSSLPAISNTGAATLQLSTNTLNCQSYSQSGGTLDFNGEDVTTIGNFTLTSGTSSSFANLTGRTLTVGGNASFAGSAGNLVDLNLGAWTITTAGALTADYATIYGSNASGGSKGVATHSYNAKSNTNWLFSIPATLTNLTKSVRLNFNTTSSGANVSGNVTNFPLFINFTSSNLTFSATSDSGTDLIFVDKDGTTLYHDVVEWDKPNQTGKVWVRVPQVDGNSTTDYITLYYGCDSCTTDAYEISDSVYTVFKSVYHLNAPEAKAYDASALRNHGTYVSNLPNLDNGGIVSKNAAVFDGNTNSYIDIPNESNYDLTTNISLWAWIKVGSFNAAWQAIVTKADNTYRLARNNATNGVDFACQKSGIATDMGGTANVNDGNWHLVVGTYAGDSLRLYVDGARDGAGAVFSGSVDVNNLDVHIGDNAGQTGRVFNGEISEVRIGNTATALSSDFIKLSYQTQKANSTFLTAFTTASFQSSKTFKLNTTASGANVTGTVTNFPLLIRLTGVSALGVQGTGTTVPTDIRFLDGDGVTWLDYQVERWDRTQDSAEVWVRVPTVEGNYAGHTITMYYKQASGVTLVDGQCASCVFNSSNGYVGVWHLGDASGTTSRPNAVSSGTNDAAPKYNGAALNLTPITGYIGKADTLRGNGTGTGTIGDHFDLGSLAAGTFTSGKITMSMWAKPTSFGSTNWVHFFSLGNSSGANGNNEIWFGRRGSTDSVLSGEVMDGLNNTTRFDASNGSINTGSWQYFTLAVNGANDTLYRNGAYLTSQSSGNVAHDTIRSMNYIGRSTWTGDSTFRAALDEVRVSNVTRSADWVKLEYQNQRRDAAPLFNPSPADFKSTQKLVFNTTKTGANVSGNVTNFPLLVRLTGLSAYGVNGSGTTAPTDIRFLDGDGTTWLNYVVERWDRTGGIDSADIWVLVPQIDGNSDHDFITMYYAQATGVTVPDGQCGSCVFGSATGFTGIWHMDDNAASSTVTETVTPNNGTYKNATVAENTSNHTVAGYIGKSLDFQGGTAGVGGGTQTDNFTHSLQLPKTTGTISHWVKPDQVRTMVTYYESDGTAATTYNGFGTTGTNQYEVNLGINGTAYGMIYQDGTSNSLAISGGSPASGTWAHVAATWNRSGNEILYVNGVQVASTAMTAITLNSTTPTVMQVGRTGDATDSRHWDGAIDEIQVSNVERSPDWMKLEYETQRKTGNVFWNSRSGPNNKATLTATATSSSNIALAWSSTVSDSSNADSVGIWVKYSGYPDSANASGATFVAKLAKTDTAYSYPATYPTTYYFALAVRNTSGLWSPVTSSSSDTVTLVGVTMPDTVYVDSAIGSDANTCSASQNPSTPKLTITSAVACGASATDTLVVRALPGTFANDNSFTITSKPTVVTSFDNVTRAVLAGNGSVTDNAVTYAYAVALNTSMTLRNMDVKANATTNAHVGIYVRYDADSVIMTGNRVYLNGSNAFDTAIVIPASNNVGTLIANNLIYKPNKKGINVKSTSKTSIMNNVIWGLGSASSQGIGLGATPASPNPGFTITNNILYNWDFGLKAASANAFGTVSNNLFFLVTSGQEASNVTDATGNILKDPLFANTTIGNPNAFKLLPGSPGIDAGTATISTTTNAWGRTAPTDYFGTSRPLGTAPDIGLYEGTGYTPTPSGEFDTLAVTSTSTTVTVQNSKWKLIWDQARGAGITQFYDKVTNSANLLASNSLLFDAKIDSYTASSQTSTGPVLSLIEGTRARAVVRQRLPVSASLDLNIYYSVYSSGHVYIESELSNLAAATTTVGTVDYTLKLGTTTAAYTSSGTKNGFGYLTTSSRGALLSVTRDLDGGASGTETWATSTAASGSPGTVLFNTTDLADLSRNTVRRHDFLLYIGDNSLTYDKAAAINADAYKPSTLSMSAGSLIGERSWQEVLNGHWTLDDGAGSTARDKAVFNQNNATLAGANYKWVSGKVGGGLYLTATDSAYAASATVFNPANGFTVMFWLKPDFAGMGDTALIVSKGLSNASGWYCRKVTGVNKVLFNMGGTTVTSPTLTDGVWTHIAVVADNAGNKQLEMYINGVQSAASTAAAVVASNTNNLVFGYASGSVAAAKFQGTLDDIRIYGREVPGSDIQSIYDFGFSSRYGQYAVRADNNNRVVALINGGAAQTRVQPAFYISNWFGPRNPKYVFLNGTKLTPNVDYVVDSLYNTLYGGYLTFQLNKILTGADQTLFIDDDDSTGFMGTASAMKSLTITATSGSKIAIKNFSDTVFSSAASGQWYMELGLKGYTTPTVGPSSTLDSGFGDIHAWKAAAVSPNVAISSAYQMVGYSLKSGRTLSPMKLDATGTPNETFTSGLGYLSPAVNTYTLVDSSSTRLSLTLSADSLSGEGTAAITKRFTFYPTGRVFVSYQIRNQSINFDTPRLDLNPGYDGGNASLAWSTTTCTNNARGAWIGGDLNFHPIGLAILSLKNATSTYTTAASLMNNTSTNVQTGSSEQSALNFNLLTSLWTSANKPVTINFMMDFSKRFPDSATADSVLKDCQTPAALTAITGTAVTNDALDFNADGFAEGDGAYTYAASSGVANFKFVNTVASFYPAFRISSWTQGTLPDFVVLDNQVLTKGYQYNAYLNTATNTVVMQFNKTLAPGTHVFFISQKSGLAVKLNRFEALGGQGVDSLSWTTQSEFENLGFYVWRRALPDGTADSLVAKDSARAAGGLAAAKAASGTGTIHGPVSKAAAVVIADTGNSPDTLPSASLSAQDLAKLGYVRISPKPIPGATGGSSASTRDYQFVDRTAGFGNAYQYLLQAVDFNGGSVYYGPRAARPLNPLTTELLTNFPNPFNPITTLRFSLRDKLKVSLIIYDARGRMVRTLVRPDKALAPGKYSVIWDARNEAGVDAPSGQYYYRFTAGRYVKARPMLLIK